MTIQRFRQAMLVLPLLVGASIPAGASAVAQADAGREPCVDGPVSARSLLGGPADPNAKMSKHAFEMVSGVPDLPVLPAGSVAVDTVFHILLDHEPSAAERAALNATVADQMTVLNRAFAGQTAADAASTPMRYVLADTTFTNNPAWAGMRVGSKAEKQAKAALRQGDGSTLNVYVGDIDPKLLGWAYYLPDEEGQAFELDGVAIQLQSMPGGNADGGRAGEGDTLVHEVGHWISLLHTFDGGCGRSDLVADTPAHNTPTFECAREGIDTCQRHPGVDPVHNFMNYSEDGCMDHFTAGQAKRMSNAWEADRA